MTTYTISWFRPLFFWDITPKIFSLEGKMGVRLVSEDENETDVIVIPPIYDAIIEFELPLVAWEYFYKLEKDGKWGVAMVNDVKAVMLAEVEHDSLHWLTKDNYKALKELYHIHTRSSI